MDIILLIYFASPLALFSIGFILELIDEVKQLFFYLLMLCLIKDIDILDVEDKYVIGIDQHMIGLLTKQQSFEIYEDCYQLMFASWIHN